MLQVQTDMMIRKVGGKGSENPTAGDAYEARLVATNDHSHVYVRGSYGLTEQEAIENLVRRINQQNGTVTFK